MKTVGTVAGESLLGKRAEPELFVGIMPTEDDISLSEQVPEHVADKFDIAPIESHLIRPRSVRHVRDGTASAGKHLCNTTDQVLIMCRRLSHAFALQQYIHHDSAEFFIRMARRELSHFQAPALKPVYSRKPAWLMAQPEPAEELVTTGGGGCGPSAAGPVAYWTFTSRNDLSWQRTQTFSRCGDTRRNAM